MMVRRALKSGLTARERKRPMRMLTVKKLPKYRNDDVRNPRTDIGGGECGGGEGVDSESVELLRKYTGVPYTIISNGYDMLCTSL